MNLQQKRDNLYKEIEESIIAILIYKYDSITVSCNSHEDEDGSVPSLTYEYSSSWGVESNTSKIEFIMISNRELAIQLEDGYTLTRGEDLCLDSLLSIHTYLSE